MCLSHKKVAFIQKKSWAPSRLIMVSNSFIINHCHGFRGTNEINIGQQVSHHTVPRFANFRGPPGPLFISLPFRVSYVSNFVESLAVGGAGAGLGTRLGEHTSCYGSHAYSLCLERLFWTGHKNLVPLAYFA